MRRTLLALFVLLGLAGPAAAQRPLVGTTLTLTDTSADALHVGCAVGSSSCTGGVKAGPVSGSTITATTVFSGSGASLTSIPETAITDGAILARVAADEVITGKYRFSGFATFGAAFTPGVNGLSAYQNAGGFVAANYYNSSAATDAKWSQLITGNDGGWVVRFVNDAGNATIDPITVARTGVSGTLITFVGAYANTATITPAALAAGNNNNYAPTGFATAYRLRLTSGAASVLTGIAGGTDGREIVICTTNTTSIGLSNEDGNSTAANRIVVNAASSIFPCARLMYDGGLARWVVFGDLK